MLDEYSIASRLGPDAKPGAPGLIGVNGFAAGIVVTRHCAQMQIDTKLGQQDTDRWIYGRAQRLAEEIRQVET